MHIKVILQIQYDEHHHKIAMHTLTKSSALARPDIRKTN